MNNDSGTAFFDAIELAPDHFSTATNVRLLAPKGEAVPGRKSLHASLRDFVIELLSDASWDFVKTAFSNILEQPWARNFLLEWKGASEQAAIVAAGVFLLLTLLVLTTYCDRKAISVTALRWTLDAHEWWISAVQSPNCALKAQWFLCNERITSKRGRSRVWMWTIPRRRKGCRNVRSA